MERASLTRTALSIAGAIALMVSVGLLNLPHTLGAHPWWSLTILWIGTPIGIALGVLLSFSGLKKSSAVAGLVSATILAYALAYWGKTAFAASYAENHLAGQAWYFGWIAVATFGAAAVTRTFNR